MSRQLFFVLFAGIACGVGWAQESGGRAEINPLAHFEPKDFMQTLQRPLFSASRRPSPPEPELREAPPPPPPEPPSLVLLGVVTDARGGQALVRSSVNAKIRSLRRGDEIEGWTVVEIARQGIVIGRDTRVRVVAMFAAKPRPAKAAAHQPDDE